LLDDFCAVSVVYDHLLDAAQLAFDACQPRNHLCFEVGVLDVKHLTLSRPPVGLRSIILSEKRLSCRSWQQLSFGNYRRCKRQWLKAACEYFLTGNSGIPVTLL
jgi:hypothetical protein